MAQITQSHQRKTLAESLFLTQRARWSTKRANSQFSKLQKMTILKSFYPTSAKVSLHLILTARKAPAWALAKQTDASSLRMHTSRSQWNWAISSILILKNLWLIATIQLSSLSSSRKILRGAPKKCPRGVPRKCLKAAHKKSHQISLLKLYNFPLYPTTLRRTITQERTSPCSIGVGRLTIQPTRSNQASLRGDKST